MIRSAPAQDSEASRVSWRIATVAFLGGIGGGVVFPILPTLGLRMGLSALMIGVILAANRIVRIGMNPVTGVLVDRFGGRGVIAAGLFIEGVGTLGYIAALHFATPAAWFLAGRLVWGAGSSLLFVGAVAAVLAASSGANRGRLVARARSAISLGVPGGLVLGGLVTDFFSADAAFLAALVLSVGSGVAALAGIPRLRPAGSPANTTHLSLDGLLQVLRQHRLAGIWFYAALVSFSVQGLLLATLVLLVDRRGISIAGFGAEGSAGLLLAILMLAYAGTSLSIGRRLDALGRRTRLLGAAVALLVAGYLLLAFTPTLALILVALVVIGVGTGAIVIPLLTLIGDLVAPGLRGRATAIYQVASDCGGTAGPIVGLILGVRFGFFAIYAGVAALFVLSLPVAVALARAERPIRD
ncbi:MAG TPA: MFS transporter [Rhodanobacteraceae bacterium]|nr:MFS transporter [Rhodanobacteraceae bacterium]